jgi:hypothetical protein
VRTDRVFLSHFTVSGGARSALVYEGITFKQRERDRD